MCHRELHLGSIRQMWPCLQESHPCTGEIGIERVIKSMGGVITWMPCAREGRNHAFWSPHCSNPKNAPISWKSVCVNLTLGRETQPFHFQTGILPPCVFGKHRCLGVFPLTITEIVHNYEWFWLTSAPTKP